MRRIREIQKSAAQQNDDETKQPVKALWKLTRYDAVPSRVKQQLNQVVHTSLTYLLTYSHTIVVHDVTITLAQFVLVTVGF